MDTRAALAGALLVLGAAGCSGPEKEWLKVNQPYTADEFRKDVAACTRGSRLDEDCMKTRGWVSVNAQRTEKAPEPMRGPTNPRPRY